MLSSWWGGGSTEAKDEVKTESKDDDSRTSTTTDAENPSDVVVQESKPGTESEPQTDAKSPLTDKDAAITAAKEWGSK